MIVDAHDELRDLAGLYVLGALTPSESAAFEAHAATCLECAESIRLFGLTLDWLGLSCAPADPPLDARARVLRAISTRRAPLRSEADRPVS